MYEILNYDHSDTPKLDSEIMKEFARELYDELRYFQEARSELETIIWPACDRAYACIRELPENDGMQWVDQSEIGETDIRDGVKFLAESIALSLMPRDQHWFDPIPSDPEKQPDMNKVRDYLAAMHRKSDTRGQYEKHLKQVLIRGTGAITWSWKKKIRNKRLGPASVLKQLADAALEAGVPVSLKDLKDEREQEVVFDGWQARPIDMYDYYLDPNADLSTDDDLSSIMVQYLSLEDLKTAEDETGEKIYQNLDGLTPLSIEEIYGKNTYRYESIRNIGINPLGASNPNAKYVPVYVFHKMRRNFKDLQFVDTYIYLAVGADRDGHRIIAVKPNPSNFGSRLVFVDTYDDYLNCAYGVGVVEKSLTAWDHKNVLSALTLQAQLACVFPAWNVIGGMLLDERRLRLGPGDINFISLKPSIGTDFMAPVPVPQNLQQVGELAQRWLGEKINGQMGAYGAVANDPTKTITQAKTATQVNTESTSGAVGRDNLIERISNRTLEPLLQCALDAAKQWAEDKLSFESATADGHELQQMEKSALEDVDRVIATGFHGMINKQNEIRELNEALVAMAQAMGIPGMSANLTVPYMQTVFKLLARLGVQNLDQFKGDPLQLLLNNPEIQMQLQQREQQAAMQGAQAMHDELMGLPPEGVPMPGSGADPQSSKIGPAVVGGAPVVPEGANYG